MKKTRNSKNYSPQEQQCIQECLEVVSSYVYDSVQKDPKNQKQLRGIHLFIEKMLLLENFDRGYSNVKSHLQTYLKKGYIDPHYKKITGMFENLYQERMKKDSVGKIDQQILSNEKKLSLLKNSIPDRPVLITSKIKQDRIQSLLDDHENISEISKNRVDVSDSKGVCGETISSDNWNHSNVINELKSCLLNLNGISGNLDELSD